MKYKTTKKVAKRKTTKKRSDRGTTTADCCTAARSCSADAATRVAAQSTRIAA